MRAPWRREPTGERWFLRFTPEARDVLAAAQDEALRLGHRSIGTEHVLLALAADEDDLPGRVLAQHGLDVEAARDGVRRIVGLGAKRLDRDALATLGIDLDEVRRRVEETFGEGALDCTGGVIGCGMPLSPRTKQAFEKAVHHARGAGSPAVTPEGLLIGLAQVEDGAAARLLTDHGLDAHRLPQALAEAS